MGHIKEPKGVDFIIQSDPLSDKDRADISKYIADYKINKINTKTKKPKKKELS
jgi:hypothetical protein